MYLDAYVALAHIPMGGTLIANGESFVVVNLQTTPNSLLKPVVPPHMVKTQINVSKSCPVLRALSKCMDGSSSFLPSLHTYDPQKTQLRSNGPK